MQTVDSHPGSSWLAASARAVASQLTWWRASRLVGVPTSSFWLCHIRNLSSNRCWFWHEILCFWMTTHLFVYGVSFPNITYANPSTTVELEPHIGSYLLLALLIVGVDQNVSFKVLYLVLWKKSSNARGSVWITLNSSSSFYGPKETLLFVCGYQRRRADCETFESTNFGNSSLRWVRQRSLPFGSSWAFWDYIIGSDASNQNYSFKKCLTFWVMQLPQSWACKHKIGTTQRKQTGQSFRCMR